MKKYRISFFTKYGVYDPAFINFNDITDFVDYVQLFYDYMSAKGCKSVNVYISNIGNVIAYIELFLKGVKIAEHFNCGFVLPLESTAESLIVRIENNPNTKSNEKKTTTTR